MFKTIRHIIRKEFIQLRRDPKMLRIVFLPPIIQLVLLGYAANMDVKNLPLAVVDLDNSQESRALYDIFLHSEYFQVVGFFDRQQSLDSLIDYGDAAMALIIPRDFGKEVNSNSPPQIQLLVDGAESNSATIGLNYAVMMIQNRFRQISIEKSVYSSGKSIAAVSPETRVWFNPELKSRNFMVPGILGLLLMVLTMILTSLAVVKEKEIGTIEQLIVSPIKPYQLIIGKLTPFAFIAMIVILLVLSVAFIVFQVPLRGSIVLLLVLCFVFLLTTLGLGLFVSTVSRNQQQAMVTSVFFVMMPMVFLSGFVFPIENMPKVIQFITYLLPLRYFYTIIRGIFLKGIGLEALWDESLALLAFGIIILTLSAMRFSKKLS